MSLRSFSKSLPSSLQSCQGFCTTDRAAQVHTSELLFFLDAEGEGGAQAMEDLVVVALDVIGGRHIVSRSCDQIAQLRVLVQRPLLSLPER